MRHGLGYIAAVGIAVLVTAFVCGWRPATDAKTYDPLLGCDTTDDAADPLATLRISVDFQGHALDIAIDAMGQIIGQPIEVDYKRLAGMGVAQDQQVWLTLRDTPATTVLELLALVGTQNAAVIDRSDGVIRLAVRPVSDDDAPPLFTFERSYDVRRLVDAGVERWERRRPHRGNWFTIASGSPTQTAEASACSEPPATRSARAN